MCFGGGRPGWMPLPSRRERPLSPPSKNVYSVFACSRDPCKLRSCESEGPANERCFAPQRRIIGNSVNVSRGRVRHARMMARDDGLARYALPGPRPGRLRIGCHMNSSVSKEES